MTMAATLKSYIQGRGVDYEVLTHLLTESSHETAEATPVDEGHLAKAVLMHDAEGAVLVVVPADSWVDQHAVSRELDRDLTLAAEEDSGGYFPDCERGALPAIGPAYGIQTLVDYELESLAWVCFEAGDHRTLIKVRTDGFFELLASARRGRFSHAD
ncbi:YbaK/EbsC family protein [Marinobacterium sp. D7]|uniref:aminoacyl-tRNA deacylase n=1 Tax=Marinobacterium ramblicola TaxID=2849041 RepID=UPI001C2D0ADD|nr:YbaK/EbsC family protein [Marinobacterium ramblicola]MBV1789424.1 YbaK/EbsC family protein [Marinobacterium ramblicola]